MALYKILIVFEVKEREGEASQNIFEHIAEFESMDVAEDFLESQMSMMISEFSQNSLEWTMLEKSVASQEQKESDHIAMMVE
ncbi:MAG TPA: hypothetical protein VFG10_15230 [Saprospiraceae bacterium]|nr:hypothetical protein [Saprospiraceae bacterium]